MSLLSKDIYSFVNLPDLTLCAAVAELVDAQR